MSTLVPQNNIISSIEFKKLERELAHRKDYLRIEISRELKEASDLGDGPENFPLDAAISKQRINERRIQELEGFLNECVVSDQIPKSLKIKIGSSLEIQKGKSILLIKIVTPDVLIIDRQKGNISSESDLGKNLIGKKMGDIIDIKTPLGINTYKILKIT